MARAQSFSLGLRNSLLGTLANFLKSYVKKRRFHFISIARIFNKRTSPQRILLTDELNHSSAKTTHNFSSLWQQSGLEKSILEPVLWDDIQKICPHSIAGYIPYLKGRTRIGIYHFFSINYGLRKQLLGHVALIRNGSFVASYRFNLPVHSFLHIDLNKIFSSQDGDTCYVELYHPKIPANHGGHDGHLRFWGIYGEHASTVHSMPIENLLLSRNLVRSCRSSFPSLNDKSISNKKFFFWGGETGIPLETTQLNDPTPFGFYSLYGKENSPVSIWHSAEYAPAPAPDFSKQQLVALPPFSQVDVLLSFKEAIKSRGTADFYFYDKNNFFVKNVSLDVSPEDQLLASGLFPNTDIEGGFIVVDLTQHKDCIHHCYIQTLYYSHSVAGDCVHSHQLTAARFSKAPQLIKYTKGSCLKFMHFPLEASHQSWLAIWTIDQPVFAKIRFITSTAREYLVNIEIPPTGIYYVEISEILRSLLVDNAENAVAQLESSYANFNASLFTYSKNSHTVSVDHLTGG